MESKKFLRQIIPSSSFYLWIILLLTCVIAVLDWRIAIPAFLLLCFLVYYNIRSESKRKKELTSYIENLNFKVDIATKDVLLNFPMPMVVAGEDGSIIWYNSSFKKIADTGDVNEKIIRKLIETSGTKNKNSGNVSEPPTAISTQMTINDRCYQVLCNFANHDDLAEDSKHILIIYFNDITEFTELKKQYADEKLAAGIFVIDNYDDLMQSMEDANAPQMLAEIDKRIIQWLSFANGVVKKYERDKYLFLFECKHMEELEKKKFDILDTIKEINVGNKIPVTLSLGFGLNGKTPEENFKSAAASIDIALGRGGDQVVIKNGDSFSFFGGKTRELEKRTKVKARVMAFALRELIDQSPQIIIMGHENADIDSLGASMGLYRMAKNRGKNAYIVLNKINPTIEYFVTKIQKNPEYSGLFINREEALYLIDKKTLLIIVDTHRPGFTEIPELIQLTGQIVTIDHHRRGADYIQDTVLTYQETYASSTCELVTEILQYIDNNIKLSPIEAEALYAGIVIDTKNFMFKTGVRTFEAASYLRRQGVDTLAVKHIFQNDLNTYLNILNIVKNAEIINGEIAISFCPQGLKNAQLIAAKTADELLNLSGIAAAFVLSSMNNEVWISGRSLGDINVQLIMEKLGGGGHLTVAGAQLTDITIEDAKEKLKCAIIEYMKEMSKSNT